MGTLPVRVWPKNVENARTSIHCDLGKSGPENPILYMLFDDYTDRNRFTQCYAKALNQVLEMGCAING